MKNNFFSKLILIFLFSNMFFQSGSAQEVILKPVEGLGGLFSDIKITKVRMLSETEEALNVEVSYEIDNDTKYVLQGAILNSRKSRIKEIESSKEEVKNKKGVLDLSFNFKSNLSRSKYNQPYLDSRYVRITFTEAGDDFFDDLPGDIGSALGESFDFEYKKKWRVGGGMVIDVPIKPIGKAMSIRRN